VLDPGRGPTITTGVYAVGQYQSDFGSVFALLFLATLPVLAFYLALRGTLSRASARRQQRG
jgi:raffinose/stachyose/melibiose transport system permease protein